MGLGSKRWPPGTARRHLAPRNVRVAISIPDAARYRGDEARAHGQQLSTPVEPSSLTRQSTDRSCRSPFDRVRVKPPSISPLLATLAT